MEHTWKKVTAVLIAMCLLAGNGVTLESESGGLAEGALASESGGLAEGALASESGGLAENVMTEEAETIDNYYSNMINEANAAHPPVLDPLSISAP